MRIRKIGASASKLASPQNLKSKTLSKNGSQSLSISKTSVNAEEDF